MNGNQRHSPARAAVVGGAVLAGSLLVGGVLAGAALASAPDDDGDAERETAITGPALERASAAAVAHTGEGTVTGTEVGDEESYYEVEVTLENGAQVDVQLDEGFAVVSSETDGAEED